MQPNPAERHAGSGEPWRCENKYLIINIIPIEKKHLQFVQKYASNPQISATTNVPDPYPIDGALKWYELISKRINEGTSKVFAILKESEFCGVVSLNSIDNDNKTADIDYWIALKFQGKGVATEAVYLAIEYAYSELNLSNFMSSCLLINPASGRVLEKNGFNEIAVLVSKDGKFKNEKYRRFKLEFNKD